MMSGVSRGVRVRTRGYVAFFWCAALLLSGASAAGAVDHGWSWPAVAWVAAPLVLAARGSRCSVEVDADEVVIRNLVRTHRLRRADVTDVGVRGYDGFWVRGSASQVVGVVTVTAAGRVRTAGGLVGRRRAALAAAARIRELVGLPPMPPGGRGAHRRAGAKGRSTGPTVRPARG
jgi:hypothetical protein